MFITKKQLRAEVEYQTFLAKLHRKQATDFIENNLKLERKIESMKVAHQELLENYKALKDAPVPEILKREVSE